MPVKYWKDSTELKNKLRKYEGEVNQHREIVDEIATLMDKLLGISKDSILVLNETFSTGNESYRADIGTTATPRIMTITRHELLTDDDIKIPFTGNPTYVVDIYLSDVLKSSNSLYSQFRTTKPAGEKRLREFEEKVGKLIYDATKQRVLVKDIEHQVVYEKGAVKRLK